VVELVDWNGFVLDTRRTGDPGSYGPGEWEACMARNSGVDAPVDTAGLYCFDVAVPDLDPQGVDSQSYTLRVAASNFEPGGALYDHFGEEPQASLPSPEQSDDVVEGGGNVMTYDFGYYVEAAPEGDPPGTGTIGYWKNHAEAWPVDEIELGGATYSRDDAIALMNAPVRGDVTIQLAKQLIAAKLNVEIGNESSCVDGAIADADAYLASNPVGSKPKGSSKAAGEALKTLLDEYNNGQLCAPHRG